MKNYIILLLALITWLPGNSQAPEISWQNVIGGSNLDDLRSTQQTFDGGYILGGYSSSTNTGDKIEVGFGPNDYWVVKIDTQGIIEWQNTIGGSGNDRLQSIQQTLDHGYILGGYSSSPASGDKTEDSYGNNDYWVIRLDSNGNIIWQNNIGGLLDDLLQIVEIPDSGYILSGSSTSSISFDKSTENFGGYDYWILKLDTIGNILWQTTIGGAADDYLRDIEVTEDGGYLVGGYSNSNISGNKTENSKGGFDFWILKLDNLGSITWQRTIGGNNDDIFTSLDITNDNDYMVAGSSSSNVSGDKSEPTIGPYGHDDFWILNLDSVGNIQWQNTIGGDSYDHLSDAQQTNDGGYILGGISISEISGDKTEGNFGQDDFWIVKTSDLGIIEWQKVLGGNAIDKLTSIQQTYDNGYIIGGRSNSIISGNKTEGNMGDDDYWVIKLSPSIGCIEITYYADTDSDGFGNALDSIVACTPPAGYNTNNNDCDDTNAEIYPGALEMCNAIDDNCDGEIDEGVITFTYYEDMDLDGYGNVLYSLNTCSEIPPEGYVLDSMDCDDLNNMIHPASLEICNEIDDNCNNIIDDGLLYTYLYIDADFDGYGNSLIDTLSCFVEITGYSNDSTDCDDTNSNIYPGAIEVLNGIDDNCNELVDEGFLEIHSEGQCFLTLYPNPNHGFFYISATNINPHSLAIEVYNIYGDKLEYTLIWLNNKIEILLPSTHSGIAFVKIKYSDIVIEKLVYIL